MLSVVHTFRTLKITRSGHLLRWLGPAIRGMIGNVLKPAVCKHSPHEQSTTWKYCKGCPSMKSCPYGETMEASPDTEDTLFKGQEDGFRPLIIAPNLLPVPQSHRSKSSFEHDWIAVQSGFEILLRISFIGSTAITHVDRIWDALTQAGSDPNQGFDPDRVTFELLDGRLNEESQILLPLEIDPISEEETVVQVNLTSPLFLRSEHEGKHFLIEDPTFADLLRASLRVLGGFHALYDHRLDADFADLKDVSTQVPTLESRFRSFYQPRKSNRTGHSGRLHGIVGSAIYGPVPSDLIPWLAWGGILGVGSHRVAGAGTWSIEILD